MKSTFVPFDEWRENTIWQKKKFGIQFLNLVIKKGKKDVEDSLNSVAVKINHFTTVYT